MAFRFNFSNSVSEEVVNVKICPYDNFSLNSETNIHKDINCDVTLVEPHFDPELIKKASLDALVTHIGSCAVKRVSPSFILNELKQQKESKILLSEKEELDIVPGVYEGGLKIWECAIDLANYIHGNKHFTTDVTVLELGCGAGIPGIIAYINGCNVTFQDFNTEVLKLSTIPNILLNTSQNQWHEISKRCSFISGDWQAIENHLNRKSKKYQIILSSETIYEKQNQKKLLQLMKSVLEPNGIIFLAAKECYFGVGGSLYDFENLVKQDNSLKISTVYKTEEGVLRRIIQMEHL